LFSLTSESEKESESESWQSSVEVNSEKLRSVSVYMTIESWNIGNCWIGVRSKQPIIALFGLNFMTRPHSASDNLVFTYNSSSDSVSDSDANQPLDNNNNNKSLLRYCKKYIQHAIYTTCHAWLCLLVLSAKNVVDLTPFVTSL